MSTLAREGPRVKGRVVVEWNETSLARLKTWVNLNKSMDGPNLLVHSRLTEIEDLIRVMEPVSDSYLQQVLIDGKIADRAIAYAQLGNYLRRSEDEFPYMQPLRKMHVHANFLLWRDGEDEEQPYQEEYDIITGIVHQAWMRSGYEGEGELPWKLIDWRVVHNFVPHYARLWDSDEYTPEDELTLVMLNRPPSESVYERVPFFSWPLPIDLTGMDNRYDFYDLLARYISRTSASNVEVMVNTLSICEDADYKDNNVITALGKINQSLRRASQTMKDYVRLILRRLTRSLLEAYISLVSRTMMTSRRLDFLENARSFL